MESSIRRVSEALARQVDRRDFLKKSAASVFTVVTAASLGSLLGRSTAYAITCTIVQPNDACHFLNGICGGCTGSTCPPGTLSDCGGWTNGCWCTEQFCKPVNNWGYYECCDCKVGVACCGCQQFVHISQCPLTPAN
jgi:hypothetical protein